MSNFVFPQFGGQQAATPQQQQQPAAAPNQVPQQAFNPQVAPQQQQFQAPPQQAFNPQVAPQQQQFQAPQQQAFNPQVAPQQQQFQAPQQQQQQFAQHHQAAAAGGYAISGAAQAPLSALINGTEAMGERNGYLPPGIHVLRVAETQRSTRKAALGVTFEVLMSDQPSVTPGTRLFLSFQFGQDNGAARGQLEMRSKAWNAFAYKLYGFEGEADALAAGFHAAALVDACAVDPTTAAGRVVAVQCVPDGKTDEQGNPYTTKNWAVYKG
jgi:hypothetical protein